MLSRLRTRIAAVSLMAFAAVLMAVPAFAQEAPASVTGAITDAAAEATGIVTFGIPIVLGVAVLWVGLKFGKRLLGKL
jgi:hypothetical protein